MSSSSPPRRTGGRDARLSRPQQGRRRSPGDRFPAPRLATRSRVRLYGCLIDRPCRSLSTRRRGARSDVQRVPALTPLVGASEPPEPARAARHGRLFGGRRDHFLDDPARAIRRHAQALETPAPWLYVSRRGHQPLVRNHLRDEPGQRRVRGELVSTRLALDFRHEHETADEQLAQNLTRFRRLTLEERLPLRHALDDVLEGAECSPTPFAPPVLEL